MQRIYCNSILKPSNEKTNEVMLHIAERENEVKEMLNKEEWKHWLYEYHRKVRGKMDLPNEIFVVAKSKDAAKVVFAMFQKEPDGNCYDVFYDEEMKCHYILVNE